MNIKGKLVSLISLSCWFKLTVFTTFLLVAISGCRLDYKPLSESVGYNINHLELTKYKIEYYAQVKFEYSKLENHLLRYASEICLSEFSLEKFEENVSYLTPMEDVKNKPTESKVVSAILNCEEINQPMLDRSYSSKP